MNILFVCSRNKKRSLTAEAIFKNNGQHNITSAGTEESARRRLTQNMLDAADLIFVMEKRHRDRIQQNFETDKKIIVLNIPDEYKYMDEELVAMLEDMVKPYLI
ncbi:MAG: protein tyrosine phosphatase [Sphingobacteriales bacterium]|nr:MAG: protein tyrosine phosphatase [Sphingobacteriales bacterium]